jgi:hypothetical protein
MSSTTPTELSHSTIFFDLPRELRDLIYHQLWRSSSILLNCTTRFVDFDVNLRYEGSYQVDVTDRTRKRFGCDAGHQDDWRFPPGLWASKQLLQEALAQYGSRAEWFWCEDVPDVKRTWLSTQLDASRVQDATLFLDFFEEVCKECSGKRHLHDRWRLDDELNEVVEAMVGDRMDGHGIRRLRIASFTQATNLTEEREHALFLAQRFSLVSGRADAGFLELSLWHDDPEMPRLYDVVGEGPDARATLKEICV